MNNGSSVSPGPQTFTIRRVERQLRDDMIVESARTPDYTPFPFSCLSLEYAVENGVHHYFSDQKKEQVRESFCRKLYDELGDPKSHVQRLDALYSGLVLCNFPRRANYVGMPSSEVPDPDSEWPQAKPNEIISDACAMLRRLPATPLSLPEDASIIDAAYFHEESSHNATSNTGIWQSLQVASYISTNVIRVALMVAIYRMKLSGTMVIDFINTTADLMSSASRLSATADTPNERTRWLLIRSFLWTSWQRSSMLYFHSNLSGHVLSGFNDHSAHNLALRGFSPVPGLSVEQMSRRFASQEKPASMCGWAFELLRSDPCAIGSDFRRFHQRFCMSSTALRARCIAGQEISCQGSNPDSCQRFKGMRIENQSMHDDNCQRNCRRLTWDEASYRSASGARAVDINTLSLRTHLNHQKRNDGARSTSVGFKVESLDARHLQYCKASRETLAVSHVWSHGQGGRPERGYGMNRCLHRRYSAIAISLGCDSYWMDTPCIPEDHQLRKEAIRNINKIFEQSKATLVCDRDLMNIDATDLTMEVRESILVTVVVCDWNLRAWTFLEAFRGRKNIYVLCKHAKVVSLKETVEIVYREGCIDIALLLLTVPHLLPALYERDNRTVGKSFVPGFLTIAEGGSHLTHREASRPGDDIVIWSLLIDDNAHSDAKAFWRAQKGQGLATSFLLSSAPRLKTPGLRWAPSSPAAQLLGADSPDSAYRLLALNGDDSQLGLIGADGIRATWLMYELFGGLRGSETICSRIGWSIEQPQDSRCRRNLQSVRATYMRNYILGALLRPISQLSDPVVPRGDPSRAFVGVCATNDILRWPWSRDDHTSWTWLGVYEWDMSEPLPKFTSTQDVLLV